MASPKLKRKSEKSLTLTNKSKKLFQLIYREQNKPKKRNDDIPKIKVSELISKMAFYYEKIRNAVDYKEEHLLRKNAIERILKRQIVIEGAISIKQVDSFEISRHLLTELIRAGYLPNNTIPESKIDDVALVILKFLRLKKYTLENFKGSFEKKNELMRWIIALCASELEENLGMSKVDRMVIEYMYEILNGNIGLPEDSGYKDDKEIQIFVGIHRNFLKFDQDMQSHILFKYYNENWNEPTEEDIMNIGKNIRPVYEAVQNQISHPLSGQMNRIISRYTVFFSVLTEVIEEDPVGVYESYQRNPKSLEVNIKKICDKKYKQSRKKLWRAAVRSIIYILITKSIFAALIELPATRWFGEELNMFALSINVSFPAILLFAIVLFTRLPSDDNTAKITEGIKEIIFVEESRDEPFNLRPPVKRGAVMNSIFGILYSITFLLSFGFVIWALDLIGFTWVSIVIFLFFLTFVSFFGIRIRKIAKEMIIVPPKDNILSLFSDFFYIPIVQTGKWLSERFSKVNVFVFVLDFIIEAPFKIFVEIAEDWTKYVRERKEDIV
jgi:hypothetical protein